MLTYQGGQRTSFQPPPQPPRIFTHVPVFTLKGGGGTKVVCIKELGEGILDDLTPVGVYVLDEEGQSWSPQFEPMHVEVKESYRVILSLVTHPFLNDIVVEFDLESSSWVPLYDARDNGTLFHLAHIDASEGDMVTVYTQTLDKSMTFAHVYA